MPIYMDRHDVSETVNAEYVAQIHQEDLKIQDTYGCRGLTYWFDEVRKTAFCLIEAPNENAIFEMHRHAHGQVPHQIIEVDAGVVESFLGRIEDPQKSQNTDLNIINDPAFRTIMVVHIEHHSFLNFNPFSIISGVQQAYKQMLSVIHASDGTLVKQSREGLIISFKAVSNAVKCAIGIRKAYRIFTTRYHIGFTELCIGVHAGVPVTEKNSIFEDTLNLAQRMCYISRAEIVISNEVQQLYESENMGATPSGNQIHELTRDEEKLITSLMCFTEQEWKNPGLKADDFWRNTGISKSKLYREMIRLTGKSPNVFLVHFRLSQSLQMLQKQEGNISEVAFESGFSSPSYFAKCFRKKYGIMPSALVLPATV